MYYPSDTTIHVYYAYGPHIHPYRYGCTSRHIRTYTLFNHTHINMLTSPHVIIMATKYGHQGIKEIIESQVLQLSSEIPDPLRCSFYLILKPLDIFPFFY